MIEVTGNIWQYPADWIVITTNPVINRYGQAVMGAGVAKQASLICPGIREQFAKKLQEKGNVVQGICRLSDGRLLVAYPVKHHWQEPACMDLIQAGAKALRAQWERHGNGCQVVLPRPGCGNGRLKWEDVRPNLLPALEPDNFRVITLP